MKDKEKQLIEKLASASPSECASLVNKLVRLKLKGDKHK